MPHIYRCPGLARIPELDCRRRNVEKSLTSLTVYVFNSQGNLVAQRSFTSEELVDKSATFALPHSAAGTTCDFYAVANLSLTGVTTKSALLSKVEASAADYNGTFAEVSTKAKRAGGFVMSASASKSIAEGSTTDVAMALRRTVAKALRADHDRCGLRGEIFGNDHRHGRQGSRKRRASRLSSRPQLLRPAR